MAEVFNSSREEREKWKTRSIGWLIHRLGFDKIHTRKGNGWLIDPERLEYYRQIYAIDDYSLEKVQQVQQVLSLIDNAFSNTCCLCHEPIPLKKIVELKW